jgi:hypothetical protein
MPRRKIRHRCAYQIVETDEDPGRNVRSRQRVVRPYRRPKTRSKKGQYSLATSTFEKSPCGHRNLDSDLAKPQKAMNALTHSNTLFGHCLYWSDFGADYLLTVYGEADRFAFVVMADTHAKSAGGKHF